MCYKRTGLHHWRAGVMLRCIHHVVCFWMRRRCGIERLRDVAVVHWWSVVLLLLLLLLLEVLLLLLLVLLLLLLLLLRWMKWRRRSCWRRRAVSLRR